MASTPSAAVWLPERDVEQLARRAPLEANRCCPSAAARAGLLLGVRPETGTVEVVSPASLPEFSHTLPLRDASVRLHWALGPRAAAARSLGGGFHHLGDLTVRQRHARSLMAPGGP